ncbi:MAG: phage tail sheath family protein [Clostridium sp.]|jgi:hypothetical protein|nr:phage tail sheath family protein [Clostridium sp.]
MQAKIRPGAYFEFAGASMNNTASGSSGIAVLPVALPWGATGTLISITAEDYLRGKKTAQIGIMLGDTSESALCVQEAFKYCYELLLYRVADTSTAAAATLSLATGVILTAKYVGSAGNNISVAVKANPLGGYDVQTYYRDTLQDTQTIADWSELAANDWFTPTIGDTPAALAEAAAQALTGGTDGSPALSTQNAEELISLLTVTDFAVLAVPSSEGAIAALFKDFVRNCRDNLRKYVQAVVLNGGAVDYEGIINVMPQSYTLADGTVCSSTVLVCAVTAMSAGAVVPQSNTNRILSGAVDISTTLTPNEIDAALMSGEFVFAKRIDGAVSVVQDINSLTSFTAEHPVGFNKNRILRILGDICTQIRTVFETGFQGYANNDEASRGVLLAAVVEILQSAQNAGAIQEFDAETDVQIYEGLSLEDVVLQLAVRPIDAMEKLYVTVNLS